MLHGTIDPVGMPRVTVVVRGPHGSTRFEAIVDTGFTATLSLPGDSIRRLGLLRHSIRPSLFADGQYGVNYTFWGEVEWVDGWMSLEILENNLGEALVGAGLLRGRQLLVDYGAAQSVEIR